MAGRKGEICTISPSPRSPSHLSCYLFLRSIRVSFFSQMWVWVWGVRGCSRGFTDSDVQMDELSFRTVEPHPVDTQQV
jgi:hypothetical protein